MSTVHDHDFEVPVEKSAAYHGPGEIPTSKMAITSLVFGILGLTALPGVGSIVAIATGHAARGEIRESRGRLRGKAMADVGLGLGYFVLVLALIAGLILGLAFAFYARSESPPMTITEAVKVATPATFVTATERGVKMVNEMGRGDFELIKSGGIDADDDEIIACYNAGGPSNDPEFALLTSEQLIYLKAGRKTVFELKDVDNLKDDANYERTYHVTPMPGGGSTQNFDYNTYYIEAHSKKGARMRIQIQPELEGHVFFNAIEKAVKDTGASLTPNPAP